VGEPRDLVRRLPASRDGAASDSDRRAANSALKSRVDFQIAFDVAAPPDVVWAVICDVERWHEWTPSVRSIRPLSKGPLRVGSRALVRQPRLPPAVWKVTTFEPGRSFTWVNGFPGLWLYASQSVALGAVGTRAVMSLRYEGVFGAMLARVLRDLTNRYLEMEAAGLKQRSEELARGRPQPAGPAD
jgi:hypothetical protein